MYKLVKNALKDIDKQDMDKVVIAYEPIWAIGTGKTATAIDANNACRYIRGEIEQLFDKDVAQDTSILYGGSVKSDNAKELFAMSDIDGGLVGGASLIPQEFAKIVECI